MPFEDIFSSLAKDLSILRGTKEDVDAWRRRLIYSALGKLALASVWDEEDDLQDVLYNRTKAGDTVVEVFLLVGFKDDVFVGKEISETS